VAVDARRRLVLSASIAALAILAMIVHALVRGPERLVAGDGHYVFAAARSLAYDGDLDLSNQYRVMGDRWGLGRDPTHDGWRLPAREIGPSLVMVPGLWLHWLLVHALGIGARLEPLFACLGAAASLGLCWLGCVRALDRVADTLGSGPRSNPGLDVARSNPGLDVARSNPGLDVARSSEAISAVAVFGFVVPYYAIGASGYAHAIDATIGAWLLAALLGRASARVIGALLAAALLTRLQNGLWLIWPGLEAMLGVVAIRRAGPRDDTDWTAPVARLATIAAIASLGLAPQLWLGLAHPGSARGAWGWTLGFFDVDDYLRDLARVLAGVHGLVTWTPIAGLALVGLGLAARERRAWAWPSLALLASLWLLFASVRDVDGGDAFGARRFAGIVGVLGLGLAQLSAWARERPRWRLGLRAMFVLLVVGNLVRTGLAMSDHLPLAAPNQTRGHR
jgi:hypothetical protein